MTLDQGFDLAPCGLVVCNGDGAIVRANSFFRELAGLAESTAVRTFGRCLTRPSQFIFNAKLMPQINLTGVADEVALTLAGQDGRGVPVLVNVRRVSTPEGETEHHYAVFPARERREYETDYLDAKKKLTQYRDYLRMAEKLAQVGHWHGNLATKEAYWSPEIYAILGCDPDTFVPRLGETMCFYHPDDREWVKTEVDAAIARGGDYSFEVRMIRQDTGETRYVESNGVCERDESGVVTGLFGVFHDISDFVAAKKALEASEARFRLLADNASDVITVADVNGRIEYVSPAVTTVLGFPPEHFIGKYVREFIVPEDYPQVEAAYRAYVTGVRLDDAPHIRYRILHRDGQPVWLEAHPQAIVNDQGHVLRFQDVVRDITDQKATEEALAQATLEANAAMEAKAQFLATMSHELRTPLTSIIGFSSLLRDMLYDDEHRRFSQRIWTAGQGLLALINDILDHSKLEAGQLELDTSPCSVADIAQDVVDLLEIQAVGKGLNLMIDGIEDMPDLMMLDEVRLRQILLNLVGNAVKFTQDGSVTIGLDLRDDRLRVRVTDTGAGISPEGQQRLFQRFSQVDHSVGGTGLGLMICKQLVELMGGRIGVESRLGQGSLFWFEIPVEICEIEPPAVEPEKVVEITRPGRILVADDQPAIIDLVSVLLRGQGYSIDTVKNGVEAVSACLEVPYDLILMDVNMPVMDGLLATQGIRSGCAFNAMTPIVGISAGGDARRRLCLGAGMNDMVEKPIKPMALMAAVTAWLSIASETLHGRAVNA